MCSVVNKPNAVLLRTLIAIGISVNKVTVSVHLINNVSVIIYHSSFHFVIARSVLMLYAIK